MHCDKIHSFQVIFDLHNIFAVPFPWNSLSSVLHTVVTVVIRMRFPHLLLPRVWLTEGLLMVVVLGNLSVTLHQGLTSQGCSPGCYDWCCEDWVLWEHLGSLISKGHGAFLSANIDSRGPWLLWWIFAILHSSPGLFKLRSLPLSFTWGQTCMMTLHDNVRLPLLPPFNTGIFSNKIFTPLVLSWNWLLKGPGLMQLAYVPYCLVRRPLARGLHYYSCFLGYYLAYQPTVLFPL